MAREPLQGWQREALLELCWLPYSTISGEIVVFKRQLVTLDLVKSPRSS
jgi:hypothetical protein